MPAGKCKGSSYRVVECELAHVNGLRRITWVDISISVSVTTACRIGRAIVDGVISNRGHNTENIGHFSKVQLTDWGSKPGLHLHATHSAGCSYKTSGRHQTGTGVFSA